MALKQELEFYKTFSQHGQGDAKVEIAAKDVVLLLHIAYRDIHPAPADWFISDFLVIAEKSFYDIQPKMVEGLPEISTEQAIDLLKKAGVYDATNVIYLYLKNLSVLWRRRFKFYNILKRQPIPQMEQIAPRCLLEYGNCDEKLLFAWMSWRKFIYDIDNRSAQETGYLFEPIMASCLGGESVSHTNSPIKRVSSDGKVTKNGRQIDCYIESSREAYELKLRVTIAASGQGRLAEEMSFPQEAHRAGIVPVLVVFDSTPSHILSKLQKEYQKWGGSSVVGEAAWNMLVRKAGKEMGIFITKYIKPPIDEISKTQFQILPQLCIIHEQGKLIVRDGAGNEYAVPRDENNPLCASEFRE